MYDRLFGAVACSVAGTALVSRNLDVTNRLVLIAAAFSPYLALLAPVALVVFMSTRRWGWVAVAALLTVAGLLAGSSPAMTSAPVGNPVAVRVMSANLFEGAADPDAVVGLARAEADIVSVQELTEPARRRLAAAGLDETFPYRIVTPQRGPFGAGLWSRYPLQQIDLGTSAVLPIAARTRIPGVPHPVSVLVAHPLAPWPPSEIDTWRTGMTRLAEALVQTAQSAGDGPVLVAGDFNATWDIRQFRQLTATGYTDAGRQSGSGHVRTYPSNSWLPPLLEIDHVLTRGCSASRIRSASIAGSDHRALLAMVRIPGAYD